MGIQWESQPSFPGARWDWPRIDIPNCTLMPLSARLMIHDVIFLKKPGISASSRYFNIKKDEPWVYSSLFLVLPSIRRKNSAFLVVKSQLLMLNFPFWVKSRSLSQTHIISLRPCGKNRPWAAAVPILVAVAFVMGMQLWMPQQMWAGLTRCASGLDLGYLNTFRGGSDMFCFLWGQVNQVIILTPGLSNFQKPLLLRLINTCFGHHNSDVIARLDSVPCFLPKKAIVCSTFFFGIVKELKTHLIFSYMCIHIYITSMQYDVYIYICTPLCYIFIIWIYIYISIRQGFSTAVV